VALCTICNRRPRPKDNSRLHCRPCNTSIKGYAAAQRAKRRSALTYWPQYWKVFHWKGHVVGARVEKHGKTRLSGDTPVILVYIGWGYKLDRIPKSKLTDLDSWIQGYTRAQVKLIKKSFRAVCPTRIQEGEKTQCLQHCTKC